MGLPFVFLFFFLGDAARREIVKKLIGIVRVAFALNSAPDELECIKSW